jgi:DnaJ like chaperone protein
VFNEARDSSTPTSEYTSQIRQLLAAQPDRLRDIVTLLCAIAFADGEFHQAEEHIIRKIATEFRLSDRDFQSCRATFRATHGSTTEDAYEVLGVPRSSTDAEVRAAHRRLAKEYHPDILRSKGLADDFQEFARQKMSAINDAWEAVKTERGL